MSGVKKANVETNLDKTMQLLRKALAESAKRTENTGNIGCESFNRLKDNVEGLAKNLVRELPEELKEFLHGEEAQWRSLLQRFDNTLAEGRAEAMAATQEGEKFQALKQKVKNKIIQLQNRGEDIMRRQRLEPQNFLSQQMQIVELRGKAKAAVAELVSASNLGGQELMLRQRSAMKYNEAQSLAQLAQQEYERLLNLGRDRQEKQRIAEENERNARMLNDDLASLRRRIEARNFAKFGKDAYTSFEKREIKAIDDLCNAGRFEEAIPRATALKAKLTRAVQVIEDAQLAWESAKKAAEKTLADANEELEKIDRAQLETFSGHPISEIGTLFEDLASAANSIAKEEFSSVSARVPDIMEKLRALAEKAAANQALHKQREEKMQALMQALYESKYEPPEYYLMDESNPLSDSVIVAATPNGVGNMHMKINLAGEVDFEVMNIPEGQESLCINAVREVQAKAKEAGVEFEMTDWGRAEKQGKEHIDIGARKGPTKVRTKDRQGQQS